ncbi:phosphoribosylanthranilate isomerase [Lutibacter sp.]|uniref:phosphoribosylanthranilate isomerase n=1 Tax=Lutibacter sp. TaxID=1925666 RepID=UPI0025BED80F|nr:phosphoribosylanthranilate isomerase [Lutibacter sp.]MCF6169301.1 phosphoribosylanthranilate isomerase [Lutibacter sp.]
MKIKVCGMRDQENVSSLLALKPDFVGFIFYNKSKRFATDFPQVKFPSTIKKVGVFVNETVEGIIDKVNKYQLDVVQLHGDETAEFCQKLMNTFTELSQSSCTERSRSVISTQLNHQIKTIKAFSVGENFDFNLTKPYEKYCDYFLFDTKGKEYGGNGIKFNWKILKNYNGSVPFLLSGGISKEDSTEILSFLRRQESKLCIGLDINSGFEIEPALKDIEKIKEFKNNLI